MSKLHGIPRLDVDAIVNDRREIVVRVVQNGEEVGGLNVTRLWANVLDGIFAPKKATSLRSVP